MTSLKVLNDDDARAARGRDRVDGAALVTAQQHVEAGRVDDACAVLTPLSRAPDTAVRAHAALLHAGALLMRGDPAAALAVLANIPDKPAFDVDDGYRRMIE